MLFSPKQVWVSKRWNRQGAEKQRQNKGEKEGGKGRAIRNQTKKQCGKGNEKTETQKMWKRANKNDKTNIKRQ
jgi:hypothetical protein